MRSSFGGLGLAPPLQFRNDRLGRDDAAQGAVGLLVEPALEADRLITAGCDHIAAVYAQRR